MRFKPIYPLLIIALWGNYPAQAQSLTGTVTHVRDGDTIVVGKLAVRLNGVHAPERQDTGGSEATEFMRSLTFGKSLRCELNGERTYDRLVGICYLQGIDIGETIVKAGLALDCPRYSGGRYRGIETTEARLNIKLPRYCINR